MKAIEAHNASKLVNIIQEIKNEISTATGRGDFSVTAFFVQCHCGLCSSTVSEVISYFVDLGYRVEVEGDKAIILWG